jgi:hypothetical protein
MATPIIAAIRQRRDLKESLLHTAQELAHLASVYGVVQVSYSYLAIKCRCSRRTVIRHIQRLLDLRLIRRDRLRRLGQQFFEINTYTFQIAWDTSRPRGGSDKTSRNLPPQEREKNTSLREELANQKKGFFAYPREKVQSRFTRASVRLVGALINSRMIASTFRTSGCFWNS